MAAANFVIEVDSVRMPVVQCPASNKRQDFMNRFAPNLIISLVLLVLVIITKDNLACGRH